ITNPQTVTHGDAAIAVNGGGGESVPAGNIAFSGITVHYINGYSLPYYFDFNPSNPGGMAAVSLSGLIGSGQSKTGGLGLLNGAPMNSVNIN
ncbi:MAG TPA: hypothetical protein VHZ55_29640, partial [Bryobacteraceae bacterium]|nr:hypothetical protein [Bryobacteraceae bacterium]